MPPSHRGDIFLFSIAQARKAFMLQQFIPAWAETGALLWHAVKTHSEGLSVYHSKETQ